MAASPRIAGGAGPRHQADPAEVVVLRRPAPHAKALRFELGQSLLVDTGLGVDDVAGAVEAWTPDGVRRVEPFVEDPGGDADERGPQAACRPRSRSPARALASSRARLGAIMLCIRLPASRGSRTRSTSPSMLFSCRSRPGRKSPVPSPRLDVRTHAFPSASVVARFVVWPSAPGPSSAASSARTRAVASSSRSRGRRESVSGTPESPLRVRNRCPAQSTSAGRSHRCS